MSERITLSLRAPLDVAVEVEQITADRFGDLAEREIAALPVWIGRRAVRLGDLFTVRGGRSPHVVVEGSLSQVHGLGAGMAGGHLVIDGDTGDGVAAGMTGGSVDVLGSVGDDAGRAMANGVLRIRGNAGARLAAAAPGASAGMRGGEVIVSGSTGHEAAARMRRGLVVIVGNAGEHAARAVIAGTLLVLGRTGPWAGRGSKRGSVVAVGGIEIPPTYRYACTFQPPHLRLTFTYLRRRYGIVVDAAVLDGRYRRYSGDAGKPGKGEILEWVEPR